jgi:hypothetical protein
MAKQNLTSGERLRIYQLLYHLNRSFHFIVRRLSQAQEFGVWQQRDIGEMLGLTQEVQMEINTLFLNRFITIEDDDLAQFGKVRTAMEKRLRG